MKRKITFLIAAALMLLTMMATTGRMWGQTRTEVVAYTLEPVATGSNSSPHNSYTAEATVTIDNIEWAVTGNSYMVPWRIGGKSLSNVDRTLYSKTVIDDNISKIEVTHGTASGITVNSWTLIVASDASFNNVISTLTPTFTASSTTTINRPTGADWTNCYYKLVYNVSVSGTSNKYLQFTRAKFYKEEGSGPSVAKPVISPADGTTFGAEGLEITISQADNIDVYYNVNSENDPDENSIQYTEPFTITSTSTIKAIAYDGSNYSNVATATYTFVAPLTIAQARAQGTGSVVTKGVVTSCVGTTGYIQDDEAAICVFGATLTVGDEIRVSGTLDDYNGLLEIKNPQVTVLSSGNTVNPELLTIAEAVESTNQGWYIRIENAKVTAIEGQNTTIAQGENTIAVRGISGVEYAVDDFLSLNGNIGYYNVNQIANPQNVVVQQSEDPSISASNVNIDGDATSGQIAYTISNPVSGGQLTAATTAGWLTISAINDNNVQFTCVANTETIARTATVTLTYTYNRATVTKDVTVTQAAHEAPHYTWDLSIASYDEITDPDIVTWSSNYATMTNSSKSGGTSASNYLGGDSNNRTSSRFYSGNTLTITPATGYLINSIVFTATSESYASAFAGSTWTNATATASGKTVTVTATNGTNAIVAAISGTCGFTAVTVYYAINTTPSITITPASISGVPSIGGSGELTITCTNMGDNPELNIQFCDAQGASATYDWISGDINGNTLTGTIQPNTGVARTAYLKVYGTAPGATEPTYSNIVSIAQEAYNDPTATVTSLPFAFDGSKDDIATTDGIVENGLDDGYSTSPKLKFKNQGAHVVLHFNKAPGTLTYDIKGDGFSGGTFTVMTSTNNETYTALRTYNTLNNEVQHESINNISEDVQYIKWIYTTKNEGKVALGNISLNATNPVIVVTPNLVESTEEGATSTLTLTYENLDIEDASDFAIQFYDSEENELNGNNEPDWVVVNVEAANPSGYEVSYVIDANDGDERSAYFKVAAMGDSEFVYSNLVTINQAAHVVDYATLPFNWAGGASADFLALAGCSASALSSDYAAGNAPYLIKFDADGKYLQVKTDSRPELVTIGVKMIGGGNTSTITVKASVDGETFDDGEALTISGSQNDIVNLETTRSFGSDVRYIKMVFTKGSNVGVGPISIEKYAVKYAVNLNQPQQGQGTIASDKAEAIEGEIVTLTATPNLGYAFESWTVLDGEAHEVTVTNNAFVMPASNVEVEATFTTLPKHNIDIPAAIENNVIVDATNNQAYANETVTITVDAPDNKVLATLTVTGNTSTNNITIAPEVSPYVDEYTFTMPDEDVTINATFTDAPSFTVSFSVNGSVDNDLEVSVTQGQSTPLPTISTSTPEGFSITGWAASNGSTEAVADPYTPTADITLYAILGQTISHSLVINASTPNFPTSYGTANTFTEYNLAGKKFMIQQGYKNGSILQWRAAGNSNGTGTMYNSEDLGKINTIILVYDSSDANKNFTIKAGNTENPTDGTEIEPATNNLIYTFDLSQGNYNYFVMTNGTNAGYLQSIIIDYVADLNINTVTTISSSQTYSNNIPATTCVIIDNNAEVTFTGTNNGTADNLIIKEGCQLIHEGDVAATVQKNITAYTAKDGDGWYMIATPVETIDKSVVAGTTYDLFLYSEPDAMWYAHWANPGFQTLNRGKGYLYANAEDKTINYAGLMKATDAEFSVPLSYECDAYPDMKGFNLVGNPFTRNLKLGDMKLGEATLTQFYVVNSEHTGLVTIDNVDYEIKPGEGFFVQAKDVNQTLEFNPSTKGLEDIRFIKIVAGNENGYDNAYINIGCGNTLRKTNIANLTSVYVMDQGLDYSAARVEELAGNMPVHFAPSEDGFFTITVEAKNLENINFMHLIDNIENTAINLLAEPTYTFKAGTSDNEDRFTLVFDFNNYLGVNENNLNDSFVYQSGDELILNGEGTLQVFDMMGRFVMSKEISGSERISTSTFETGVYVLRFVGETVMTQKIVIE